MKKFASLLLAVILFATMLTVFSVPAFAKTVQKSETFEAKYATTNTMTGEKIKLYYNGGTPDLDWDVGGAIKQYNDWGEFLEISSLEDCEIKKVELYVEKGAGVFADSIVNSGCAYTDRDGVSISGRSDTRSDGTPCGCYTLDNVNSDSVKFTIDDENIYITKIVVFYEFECTHGNGFENGKCNDCGEECPHTHTKTVCTDCGAEIESADTGSVLSEGSLTIIVGVAAAVVFGLGGFFTGRKKKKPALAEGAENKDEE